MVKVSASKEMTTTSGYPFQTYMMALSVLIGLPIVFGKSPAPASMEAVLHPTVVLFWGGALVIGGALSLLGSFLNNRLSGLLIEQLGLVFIGVAAIFYAVAIMLVVGFAGGGAYPAALTLVFGLSCLIRWRQIQKFLKEVAQATPSEQSEGLG